MPVSKATERNWGRLRPDLSEKLKHGANKSRSDKRIRPAEYYTHPENAPSLEKFVRLCTKLAVPREHVLFSAALHLLNGKGILHCSHVQTFLASYNWSSDDRVPVWQLPDNERDLLGLIYQYFLTEGEKNRNGSYYTPGKIAAEMAAGADLSHGELFLDPCCGSGSILLEAAACSPEQLRGCDKDPLAVFITGINLLLKYPDRTFIPRVVCCDYLKTNPFRGEKFDHIVSNPPWGSENKGAFTEDSFTLFFRKAFRQLKPDGRICFLFPVSVLNVRSHFALRKMLLTETRLKEIVLYRKTFTGVMTDSVAAVSEKGKTSEIFTLAADGKLIEKNTREILTDRDMVISLLTEDDAALLRIIAERKAFDLSESVFALGIVTGSNHTMLKQTQEPGTEAVYTGKEVNRYFLSTPQYFLHYDRTRFQQTAKEEYYRRNEKLLYRFISGKLVFAYDDHGVLCLNSANVLIPKIPGMCMKTVLAFLNSRVMQYYYGHLSGGIKVLKRNLLQLPFPAISAEMDREIASLTTLVLSGKTEKDAQIQKLIFQCYDLTSEQILQIEKML